MALSPHLACKGFPASDRDRDGRRREVINPSKTEAMVERVDYPGEIQWTTAWNWIETSWKSDVL